MEYVAVVAFFVAMATVTFLPIVAAWRGDAKRREARARLRARKRMKLIRGGKDEQKSG